MFNEKLIWPASEEEFIQIPHLRVMMDSDGTHIAYSIRDKYLKDHLYFHGPGILGVYYECETELKTIYRRKYWRSQLINIYDEFPGDCDGIILFQPKEITGIPELFLKSTKKGNSPEILERAREIKKCLNLPGSRDQPLDSTQTAPKVI